MFMGVYVRYGLDTVSPLDMAVFDGSMVRFLRCITHLPDLPPSKAQVQKHWSSQLLEKMLGVYGRWIYDIHGDIASGYDYMV